MVRGSNGSSWVLIAVMVVLWCGAMGVEGLGAPTPSPTLSEGCSSEVLGLADCLPFVEEGSKVRKPKKSCCSALKDMVVKDVGCLCDAFKESAALGMPLNNTKALSLPSACGILSPSFAKCNPHVSGVPAAAPAPAYSPSSAGESKVPAPSPGHSGSNAAAFGVSSATLFAVGLAVYSFYYL